jgi:opacity protein-like surface antigen
MEIFRKAALTMAFALPLGAVPLTAQVYHWDATAFGGYSWLTGKVLDRADFDFLFDNDVDVLDNDHVNLGNGGMFGGQLGYWFNNRWGLRGNFAYTNSDVEARRFVFNGDPFDLFDHNVNLYGLTGDLMVRLNTPRTRWDGFEWLPYVALGIGAQWVSPGGTDFRIIDDDFDTIIDDDLIDDDRDGTDAIPIRCSAILDRCAVLEQSTRFTGLAAIGMDFRFTPSFGLRLEAGDRIWEAPVKEVFVDPDFPFFFVESRDLGNTINQLYVTLGATFMFGFEHPPVRAAAVPPRPAPPPPPPPPPPSTEQISVCVVDPTSAEGVRMITATRNLTTGDTTVNKNGTTMSLSSALGNVPVAGNATWYIRGAPLTLGMGPKPLQFTPVGGERHIEASQLAYLGTVDGMPVFADRNTVAPGLTNLGPNTDLNRLLTESADARKAFESVSVLYVPTQPSGCAFTAVQKVQEVRKNDLQ